MCGSVATCLRHIEMASKIPARLPYHNVCYIPLYTWRRISAVYLVTLGLLLLAVDHRDSQPEALGV